MNGTRFGLALTAAMLLASPISAVAQDTPVAEPTPELAKPDAAPAPQPAVEPNVGELLEGVETTATPEQWAALGQPAVGPLSRILADSSQPVIRRGRAAIALGFLPSAASTDALRKALSVDGTPKHVLRKAMISLARVQGADALDVLETYLSHRSNRVREQAIRSIAGISTPEGAELLRTHSATEKSEYLRHLIRTELGRKAAPAQSPAQPEVK